MNERYSSDIAERFSSVLGGMDSEYAEGLGGDSIEEIGEGLVKFLSPEQIFSSILGVSEGALSSALGVLAWLLGLVLVCGVCTSLSQSMASGELSTGFSFLSAAVIIAGVCAMCARSFFSVTDYFERIGALMQSVIPIVGTVLAMGGNISCASVSTATLYIMLSMTERLCADAVLPVCTVMSASAVCSGLSGTGLLDGFCAAVKKIYNFILGIVMSIFVFVLGAQTLLSSSADTLAARSGKFLSSAIIPGVGGAIGETVRTLAGSVVYIKSVVGVGGIVLMGILALPVLIELIFTRLSFMIAGTVASMLGCDRESRLLSEMGNIYGFLVGAVSICTVAFVLAMTVFVRCTVAME